MRPVDLFMSLAEAISPAQPATPPPIPPTPPVIERRAEVLHQSPPPAIRQKHRLADLSGQEFEHEDLAYLQGWIAQRNAAFMAPRYAAPQRQVLFYNQPYTARKCGPSGCR